MKWDQNIDFSIKIGPKFINFTKTKPFIHQNLDQNIKKKTGKYMESQEKLTKLEALEITSSNFLGSSMGFHFAAQTIQLAKP